MKNITCDLNSKKISSLNSKNNSEDNKNSILIKKLSNYLNLEKTNLNSINKSTHPSLIFQKKIYIKKSNRNNEERKLIGTKTPIFWKNKLLINNPENNDEENVYLNTDENKKNLSIENKSSSTNFNRTFNFKNAGFKIDLKKNKILKTGIQNNQEKNKIFNESAKNENNNNNKRKNTNSIKEKRIVNNINNNKRISVNNFTNKYNISLENSLKNSINATSKTHNNIIKNNNNNNNKINNNNIHKKSICHTSSNSTNFTTSFSKKFFKNTNNKNLTNTLNQNSKNNQSNNIFNYFSNNHNHMNNFNPHINININNNNNNNNDDDIFDYTDDKPIVLSKEEKAIYGNREPKNYKKIKLLGKGGCGIVWLVLDKFGNEFAAKQISKKCKIKEKIFHKDNNNLKEISHSSQIAKKEIEMIHFLDKINVENEIITSVQETQEDQNDIWIISEKGGKNLFDLCLKIKGEFISSERIYSIKKGRFLQKLISDINQLKFLIRSLLKFIMILNKYNIVHSDIKPENILIEYNEDYSIKKLKIIDFGSAFFLDNPTNFSSNTPEYMSPEITELLDKTNNSEKIFSFLKSLIDWNYCIDIWSLGVSILEIILACPLWMSYKAKVVIRNKPIFKMGLFGVKLRDGNKIYHIQKDLSKNMNKIMSECLIDDENERANLEDLLSKMLEFNYKNRISPEEALKHSFLIEQ